MGVVNSKEFTLSDIAHCSADLTLEHEGIEPVGAVLVSGDTTGLTEI